MQCQYKITHRKSRKIRVALVSIAFAMPAVLPMGAPAQNYPVQPLRIILPYVGGTDFVGRWLTAKLKLPAPAKKPNE